MALSFLVFLPMLRMKDVPRGRAVRLVLLGAIQYGLMYVLYAASFATLAAHQVALFASLTPIWVVALDDALERRFRPHFAVAAVLAVGGAAVFGSWFWGVSSVWRGFWLMQGSNLCFAVGQVWYRRIASGPMTEYALPYAGAVVVTGAGMLVTTTSVPAHLSWTQAAVLGYLGILASGVCLFWWNLGAAKTSTGVLAVFNNVKVPLGVLVSLVVFGESTNLRRLGIGAAMLLAALWIGSGRRSTARGAA